MTGKCGEHSLQSPLRRDSVYTRLVGVDFVGLSNIPPLRAGPLVTENVISGANRQLPRLHLHVQLWCVTLDALKPLDCNARYPYGGDSLPDGPLWLVSVR